MQLVNDPGNGTSVVGGGGEIKMGNITPSLGIEPTSFLHSGAWF